MDSIWNIIKIIISKNQPTNSASVVWIVGDSINAKKATLNPIITLITIYKVVICFKTNLSFFLHKFE